MAQKQISALVSETSFLQTLHPFSFSTARPSVVPDCTGQARHLLEVLSDVLLVLVSLLLPHLADVVLQLHDGSLDLVVLTHQRHPAVELNKHHKVRDYEVNGV